MADCCINEGCYAHAAGKGTDPTCCENATKADLGLANRNRPRYHRVRVTMPREAHQGLDSKSHRKSLFFLNFHNYLGSLE